MPAERKIWKFYRFLHKSFFYPSVPNYDRDIKRLHPTYTPTCQSSLRLPFHVITSVSVEQNRQCAEQTVCNPDRAQSRQGTVQTRISPDRAQSRQFQVKWVFETWMRDSRCCCSFRCWGRIYRLLLMSLVSIYLFHVLVILIGLL